MRQPYNYAIIDFNESINCPAIERSRRTSVR